MPADPASPEAHLIGVDGGATSVKVHAVDRLPSGRLHAAGPSQARVWEGAGDFVPVPLERQLEQHLAGTLAVEPHEEREAAARVHTIAGAIAATAAQIVSGTGSSAALWLGVCMPGLKTPDGRGIAVARNGPRSPDFLDRLQAELASGGLELAAPLERVDSDGEAAGWGEEVAAEGCLNGVDSAWLVGCGTGVAEAGKLGGAHLDLARERDWLIEPWRLRGADGSSVEDLISMRGMRSAYARARGAGEDLVEAAGAGEERALEVLAGAARAFADFLFLRLRVLWRHAARHVLERVVIGQRSAQIFADPLLAPHYAAPLQNRLAQRVRAAEDDAMRAAYLLEDVLRPGLLVASKLRAAPAIGAVARAAGLLEGLLAR